MSRTPWSGTPARRHLEREIVEVEAAIELVRSGAAASVTLAGLGNGRALAEALQAAATRVGVVLEPLWEWEEDRCDLVVRKADGASKADSASPARAEDRLDG